MAALDAFSNAGLPVPGIYGDEASTALKAYQDALAQIASKQSQAAQSYGFKLDMNPDTGALNSAEIDPSQQYSQVMGLLQAHSGALHSLRESLTGQGLTGGGMRGLAAQRAALLRFQQQGQVASLGSRFAGTIGDLQNQGAAAKSQYGQGLDSAARDAINFAIQNGWFNQAAPAQAASADTGGGGSTPSNDPGAVAPVGTAPNGLVGNIGNPSQTFQQIASNPMSAPQLKQALTLPGVQPITPKTDPYAGQRNRNSF